MGLLEVIDFADMLGRVSKREADARAVVAGQRKAGPDNHFKWQTIGLRLQNREALSWLGTALGRLFKIL
jgi:hypothetical protein